MSQDDERPDAYGGRRSLRRELDSGFRRALGLLVLGAAIPGAGLTQTRSRRLGFFLLTCFLLLVAGGAYLKLSGKLTNLGLQLGTDKGSLLFVAAALAIGGLIWCASIIATAVQARPRSLDRTRTRLLALLTTVMVAVVGGTAYKGAEYTLIGRSVVASIFKDGGNKPGNGAVIAEDGDPWAKQARVNLLLMGSDEGDDRSGVRPDSMIVASIDTQTGRTVLISIPRNFEQAPLYPESPLRDPNWYPSGIYGKPTCWRLEAEFKKFGTRTDHCMLNALWTEAEEYQAEHPGTYDTTHETAGQIETRREIEHVLGLEIDHTVVINIQGFEKLVQAMGGIDINVKVGPKGLPIGGKQDDSKRDGVSGEKGWFTAGPQHLNGNLAMWYARSRATENDFSRASRQRCVIKAIVGQVNPGNMLTAFPDVAQAAKVSIWTDIPSESLKAFVELVLRVQKGNQITSLAFDEKHGFRAPANPDYELMRELVASATTPPVTTPDPSMSSVPPAKPTSSGTQAPSPTSTTTKPADECA